MTGWGVKGWRRGDTHKHAYGASCKKNHNMVLVLGFGCYY